MAMKERLLAEYHAGKHAAKAPHVQRVVIHLSTQVTALATKILIDIIR